MNLPKLSALLILTLSFAVCACDSKSKHKEPAGEEQPPVQVEAPDIHWADSLERFFRSRGVLEFDRRTENYDKSFQLLNEDNTVFATLDLGKDEIKFGSKKYVLTDFLRDSTLLAQYQFYPRDFYYPDYSIIHFEYLDLKDGVADVYLNKAKNFRKRMRLGDSLFIAEPWKEHFLGSMFSFDEKTNLIRVSPDDQAKSVGYENYTGEFFIHTIREISGDWIRIECGDGICASPCTEGTKYDGWIRWKKGNKLLIDIAYDC